MSVLLLGAFSVPVSADTNYSFDRISIVNKFYYGGDEITIHWVDNVLNYINESVDFSSQITKSGISATAMPYYMSTIAVGYNDNNSVAFKKGTKHNVVLNGFDYYAEVHNPAGDIQIVFDDAYLNYQIRYRYTDGTFSGYFDGSKDDITLKSISNGLYRLNINTSIDCEKDVSSVFFILKWSNFNCLSAGTGDIDFQFYFKHSDLQIETEQTDPKIGLLERIISGISGVTQSISNGFSGLIQKIVDLPKNLWNKFEEGLTVLFRPETAVIDKFKTDIDTLLSQKLGAVYQVGSILSSSWETIRNSDVVNTVSMPSVSLTSAGIPFTFGGYDVVIVPDGFNTVVEVLKKIISILATIAFVNGLLKRYDEVMGVE